MNCVRCNSEFDSNLYNKKYCSETCYKQAKDERQKIKRKDKYEKICTWCGNIFRSSFKKTVLCSRACASRSTAKQRSVSQKKFLSIPDCLSDASRKLDKTLGYVRVYAPMHPESNTWGYVYEHRLIAEELIIKRRLLPNEIVHHKNGIRSDNSLSNLEVMDKIDHAKLHGQRLEDL